MNFDVIVVGAGPAGSAAARRVSRAGYKVLVLEEHSKVGLPAHCSGFVTPRTLGEAGIGEDVVLNHIKGAVVYGPGGRKLQLGGDRLHALVLDRIALDQRLAQEAEEGGTQILLGARVVGIGRSGEGWLLQVQERGRIRRVSARLLVGADGVRSLVARWMGQPRGEVIGSVGAEVLLRAHPSESAQIFVGNGFAPGWFAWSIPLGGRRARLGIGVPTASNGALFPKPKQCLQQLVSEFPESFQGMEVLSYSGGFIPLYRQIQTYGDGVLLVGDAACQVKPTSGGGIYLSLVAGRLAADTAIRALQAGDISNSVLKQYEVVWKAEFASELERGLDIRAKYTELTDRELERLMSIFSFAPLQSIIRRFGDIDYPSKMFSSLLHASPILKGLLNVPFVLPLRWLRQA